MQTPMKYALALLATVALLAPITSATPPHSRSIVGEYSFGTSDLGSTTDACLDSGFQGTTSACAAIFSEETTNSYTIVANGIVLDPITLGIAAALCPANYGLGTPTGPINGPVIEDPFTLLDDPATAPDYAAAQGADLASYDPITDVAGNPDDIVTYLTDPNSLFQNGSCYDGAFTKHASDLGLMACFYDASDILLDCQGGGLGTATAWYPDCYTIGMLNDCTAGYDYKGDLVGVIPLGTEHMSVTSAVGTVHVAFWWYQGTI